jgi:hypothetical protein
VIEQVSPDAAGKRSRVSSSGPGVVPGLTRRSGAGG